MSVRGTCALVSVLFGSVCVCVIATLVYFGEDVCKYIFLNDVRIIASKRRNGILTWCLTVVWFRGGSRRCSGCASGVDACTQVATVVVL